MDSTQRGKIVVPSYLEQEDEDGSSVSSTGSEATIKGHDQVAYSTTGSYAFNAGPADETDEAIRKFEADNNDGALADHSVTPNGFLGHPYLLDKGSPAFAYITDRQFSTWADDMDTVVHKNLIVLLQAHVLFEDCLQTGIGSKTRTLVLSAMQKNLGMPTKDDMHSSTVEFLLRTYAKGRREEILCFVANGGEPPLPTSALNALLITLIDRYLVFRSTSSATVDDSGSDFQALEQRLNQGCVAINHAIQGLKQNVAAEALRFTGSRGAVESIDKDAEPQLWKRVAPMLTPAEIERFSSKPWHTAEWLTLNLPRDLWPEGAKSAMDGQGEPGASTEPDAGGYQLNQPSTSVETTKTASPTETETLTGQEDKAETAVKRKRDEDEDDSNAMESGRARPAKSNISLQAWVDNLAHRPKKA